MNWNLHYPFMPVLNIVPMLCSDAWGILLQTVGGACSCGELSEIVPLLLVSRRLH